MSKSIRETKCPLVSVIIPVYDVADYLQEALDSVIRQTYNNLEILIVDDGSTDGSGEICDRYALNDHRIIVFHQENKGLSAARNVGLDHATGDVIAFLDSDDAFRINAIETMVGEMQEYKADIVVCGFVWCGTLGRMAPIQVDGKKIDVINTEEAFKRIIERKIETAPWNRLYKKRIWEELRFPEGRVYEGTYTVFDVFSQARRIVISDKKLVMHRKRPGSICNTYSVKNIEDSDYAAKHYISFVESHTPEIFSDEQLAYLKIRIKLRGLITSYLLYTNTSHTQKGVKLSVYNACGAKIPLCRRQLLRAGL